jgi:hypothetical protein
MVNKKAAVLLIATSVLVAAVAGIAFAQYVTTQTNGNSTSQIPQGTTNTGSNTYQVPQQGYYPYAPAQSGYPYGYGYGAGRCGYGCFP